MKHTPGPWSVDWKLRQNPGVERFRYFEVCANRGMFWVCKVLGFSIGGDCAQYEANARLIAAAPEMLEALKAAQEELRLLRMKDTAVVYDPTLTHRMSLAIAKAEGLDPETASETSPETMAEAK